MRTLLILFAAALALAVALTLRPRLEAERQRLGLVPERPEDLPDVLREAYRDSPHATVAAALGIFRPLVINVLWLRSLRLHVEGNTFESAALARAITALQPRLPEVWAFHAHRLAYDVSAQVPLDERYGWILEAIELLREEGLRHNPSSPRIYEALARLFLHKIGAGADEAHRIYKERLARTFEDRREGAAALPGSAAELLAEWKLDSRFLRELAERHIDRTLEVGGFPPRLDLRSPFAHALYWAELGRSHASRDGGRTAQLALREVRLGALRGLAAGGIVVRQPGGGGLHAALPDARYLDAVRSALDERVRTARNEEVRHAARTERDGFEAWAALHLAVWGRMDEAAAAFGRVRGLEGVPDLRSLLVAAMLEGIGTPRAGSAAGVVAALVDLSLHLRLVDDPELTEAAEGVERIAFFVHESEASEETSGAATRIAFPALRAALAEELLGRLERSPELNDLAARLSRRLAAAPPPRSDDSASGPGDVAPLAPSDLPSATERKLPPYFAELGLRALDPFVRLRGLEPRSSEEQP